ncbi:hypothetical protein [Oxalobacter paraformigenes]|nr:hypothetical protein [Oxalobacter paraformigenes]
MAAGLFLVTMAANAGNTYWSVNVGVPVVAAPPPVVVYANPAIPVTAVVHSAPVVVYPHATKAVVVRHTSHYWHKPRYRGNRHPYRRHR